MEVPHHGNEIEPKSLTPKQVKLYWFALLPANRVAVLLATLSKRYFENRIGDLFGNLVRMSLCQAKVYVHLKTLVLRRQEPASDG